MTSPTHPPLGKLPYANMKFGLTKGPPMLQVISVELNLQGLVFMPS